jgi:hypothetical protein
MQMRRSTSAVLYDDRRDRTFCHRRRNRADRLPFGPPFLIAAAGGVEPQVRQNADAPMVNRTKRTTRARPRHSRGAFQPGRSEPTGDRP